MRLRWPLILKKLSTFTEAFKRCMGLLPSEYRNKYIQDKKN